MSDFEDKIQEMSDALLGKQLNLFEEMDKFCSDNGVTWRELNMGDEWDTDIVEGRMNFLLDSTHTVVNIVADEDIPTAW